MMIVCSHPGGNLFDVYGEVNRQFDGLRASNGGSVEAGPPLPVDVDVHETESGYTLQLGLPGIKSQDVKVRFQGRALLRVLLPGRPGRDQGDFAGWRADRVHPPR